MTVLALDHFTIRTARVAETVTFFRDVVRLEAGWRPGFRFPGEWLYAAGKPLLHIVSLSDDDTELHAYLGEKGGCDGGGCIDHVSLRCQSLSDMQQHLLAVGQAFRERLVPEAGEHQLFLEDPNGVTIEMIFPFSADNAVVGAEMDRLAMRQDGEGAP
ncbi:VOC family protein [Novispirillum itersonii]|uniref:VOC family protein n=1 Tax=Novispirillum itersonii TaxID=189 RepID=UPI00036A34A7|nr:VOC family protein [Novispirillum itersonii]